MNQQPVLIRNVQIVKEFDKTYSHRLRKALSPRQSGQEFRAKNVYFRPFSLLSYVFPSLHQRGIWFVAIECRKSVLLDGPEVGVVN